MKEARTAKRRPNTRRKYWWPKTRSCLDPLKDEILALHALGATLGDLSVFVRSRGILVAPSTIDRFLQKMQVRPLKHANLHTENDRRTIRFLFMVKHESA